MKLYCAAILATKIDGDLIISEAKPFAILSPDLETAQSKSELFCTECYPDRLGWTNQKVGLIELDQDFISRAIV